MSLLTAANAPEVRSLVLEHFSATHSVLTLPLVGRVGAKRRGGGRAVIR